MIHRRKFRDLLLGGILASSLALGAQASECDKSLDSPGGPNGYRDRSGPQRCEGLFVPRVGGEDLELVSLTYGAPPTPGSKPATLPMTGPAAAADTLHLRVVGKPSAFNYRMDAEFPPTGKFVWSTDVLVHDVGADLGQVGIFAFSRSSVGDILYRPVALSGDDPAYGAKPEDVIAELRPLVLVEHARWRFASQGGGATGWKTISSSEGLFIVRLAKQRMPGTLQVAWSEPGSGSVAFSLFRIDY